METKPEETFRCESFKITMPADKQRGFCAIQFRKGREICVDCERGKQAAKEDAEETRNAAHSAIQNSTLNIKSSILNSGDSRREATMAAKKLCSCGCGKGAVKDGLATKCYRKKHGHGPFEKPAKGQGKISRGKRARATGKHSHADGECEGCKILQLQLDEQQRVKNVLVAAGLIAPEKYDQALQAVRDLHA